MVNVFGLPNDKSYNVLDYESYSPEKKETKHHTKYPFSMRNDPTNVNRVDDRK